MSGRLLAGILLAFTAQEILADTTVMAPEAFLKETFGEAVPKPQVYWLDEQAQNRLKVVLGHAYPQARLRYWRQASSAGQRTAWVLDETGKEYPITAGFVVVAPNKANAVHQIDTAHVLIYRESRGDEIRYPAFLKQFQGAQLRDDQQLSTSIDGISGATLSVGAMRRMGQAALVLDTLAVEESNPESASPPVKH